MLSIAAVHASALMPLSGYMRTPRNVKMQDATPLVDALEMTESEEPPPPPAFDVRSLPGITPPLGFWDPAGFCEGASEGKIRFYREVELKHGRVAMLAALGFLVGEQYHPLWGGSIDVPSYIAYQETPLQPFWPAVILLLAVPEVFSVFTFQSPFGGETWAMRTDHEAGDLGFDPLGLKPKSAGDLAEMQTKEINNGRAPLPSTESIPTHASLRAPTRRLTPPLSLSCRRFGDDRHGRHGRAGAGVGSQALLTPRARRSI